ncbi:MAG: hypothetical protein JF591_00760 [Lysobacter sp.]|nr:hypothetical protein [Lysobacter sp.]
MTNVAPDRKSWWRLTAGYVLALLVLACAIHYLGVQGDRFAIALGGLSIDRVVLALLLFVSTLAINATAFAFANRAFGVAAGRLALYGAWLATLLAKYVPVGIGHVLGRGLVLSGYGVSSRVTAMVGLLEQIVSLGLCAAIALLAFAYRSDAAMSGWLLLGLAIAMAVATGAAIALRKHAAVKAGPLLASLACYGAAMVPYCGAYLVLVDPAEPVRFVQALFAGTVAGVLAILVPGGVGVRESVTAALSGGVNAETVLAGVVAARALILASEVLASMFGHWCLRRARTTHEN